MTKPLRTVLKSVMQRSGKKTGSPRNRFLPFLFLLAAFLGFRQDLLAQNTTITTETGTNYTGGNGVTGNAAVTFIIENTNTYPILLTGVDTYMATTSSGSTPTLWYSATSLSGAPTIAAPAWTSIATGPAITAPTAGYYPALTNLTFVIPAGTQYRFALQTSLGVSYSGPSPVPAPGTLSGGGVNLKLYDATISFSGAFPNPTNTPRAFTGRIHFQPALACTAPPSGGQAVSTVPTVCPNTTFRLSLTGSSFGTGLTFQWQSSANGTTGWTNIASATTPGVNLTQTATTWYRAELTCSGQTVNSLPVQVTTNATPVTGTFTINKGTAASATNFQSFTAAMASIECGGVGGPVVFNVVANSGPYNEEAVIPAVPGTSATNTITINGNGNTLASTSTTGIPALKLDGSDYIRVNDLIIKSEATALAGPVVHLLNGADNNIFTGNTINHVGSLAGTTISYAIYIYNGSNNNNTFQNNTIIGGYYGILNNGAAAAMHANNSFINNTIKDFFIYGIYNTQATGTVIERNDFSRPTRTNGNSFYAIYSTTGATGVMISKNRIHNTHDVATSTTGTVYGIYVGAAGTVGSENIVKNNVIYNINANGATVYALYNSGGNNTYYYHNTVIAHDPTINYGVFRGMFFGSPSTNVKFMNNNISLTSPAATKHALYLAATIALQSNNNNLYAPGGNVGYSAVNKATLADWQAVNSAAYDQASVSADPMLVNVATGDLKPTNSVLNNVGVAVTPAVADDIIGAARNATTPDPGAYEFTPAANDAGITAIVSPTSPVVPNANLPVTITLKNYGTSSLTAVTFTWTVNGVAQPNYIWTGNLASLQTANVTLGNYIYPAGNYALNICTSNPNGQADPNTGNDCHSMTVVSCSPLTGIYTINKNLAASATNFQSFTAALNTMTTCGVSSPVTFNVTTGTGPYSENIVIGNIPNTSATNTITFNGNGNNLTSPLASADAVVKLDGAKYFRFNNLMIATNSGTTGGSVVSLINAAENNIFTGNTITHSIATTSTSQAVYVYSGSSNNTFQNNTIIGGYHGIYNYSTSATATNNNNSFINNTVKDFYYYGFYNNYGTGTVVERNDFSRPTRINGTTMYAMYFSTGSTGLMISKNRIHNTHDAATTTTGTVYGIYIGAAGTAGSENIVKNNAIYNINAPNGSLFALYNTGGNNTYYYHNTVSADDANVSYNGLRGINVTGTITNVKFMNNIISLSSPASSKHAIYVGSTTTVTLQSNNNDFYIGSTGNVGYFGSNMATLADWKAANANAYDQNSVSVDPMLAGPATGNVQPTTVGVNNIGVAVTPAVTDDLLGNPRSATTPDLGAVEFTLNPDDVGITAISGPVTGCGLTATETITVTIKNYGTATQTSIPVTVSVNATPLTGMPETWTGSLAPNATVTYTFAAKANLAAAGFYKLVAGTNLTGDSNIGNNTDTLEVTNALMTGLPVVDFETVASGMNAMRVVTNTKSNVTENTAASLPFNGQPASSTKGMIMEGTNATSWLTPGGATNPWTVNPDHFSAAYMCFAPQGAANPGTPLCLSFDLKQLFKIANANTNFRVTVNGTQVGPTYRPPFTGTPINWQKVYVDLTPYKNLTTIQIGLESSVSEAFANGAGPANLVDNIRIQRLNPSGVDGDILASQLNVFPNPSNGIFQVTLPQGKAFGMEVTDLTGKVIVKETAASKNAKLDLTKAAKGVYMLKVTSEGSTVIRKIIVE
jgi:hypothetical protein